MTDQLVEGQQLGDYEILSVVGTGGMGIVYKATQRSLQRIVALKVIREEIASAPEYHDRFMREARLAASVNHPHVVSVYDVGIADEQLFLSMQWIDGEDLRQAIRRSGRLAPDRAVTIAGQIAGALDALHGDGLIHRDVKPANVLLRAVGGNDHAYLTDFGVAKPTDAVDQLTNTGWLVGTTGYISPEQIMGRDPGPGSDLYALGCLFFEALTGQPPFRGDNEMALRWAHANDDRPRASTIVPALGPRYDEFIAVALAIDPLHRLSTGGAFAKALETAHAGRPEAATNANAAPDHPPTVIGPVPPISAPPNTPPPNPPPPYPGYAYATPPPGYQPPPRSGNPLALILLGLVALAGIAVGALAAAGVFSHDSASITRTTTAIAGTTQAPGRTSSGPSTTRSAAPTTTSTTPPPLRTTSQPARTAAGVTGRDASGYNTGPGCSDNPASSLSGCADSPSIPNGDRGLTCPPDGVLVDAQTTSCGLAENVHANYTADGPLTAFSPERGSNYPFTCQTGGQGTTGYTICLGRAGNSQLYVRWHQ